jgi:hypothetical protein
MKSLLQVGRYQHGARSIAAVVELSHLQEKHEFGWGDLPDARWLAMHINRGLMDMKLIGGAIALSGYSKDRDITGLWEAVAVRLWEEGATLAFGGRWIEGPGGWLINHLKKMLQDRPPEPSKYPSEREKPAPWLINFLDDEDKASVERKISSEKRTRLGLHVRFASHLTPEERKRLKRWPGLIDDLKSFRRRLAVTDASVARFVVSGAQFKHKWRFPGIPEEVMLSLAQNKPIYVAGGFEGAAQDIGSLLGLSRPSWG